MTPKCLKYLHWTWCALAQDLCFAAQDLLFVIGVQQITHTDFAESKHFKKRALYFPHCIAWALKNPNRSKGRGTGFLFEKTLYDKRELYNSFNFLVIGINNTKLNYTCCRSFQNFWWNLKYLPILEDWKAKKFIWEANFSRMHFKDQPKIGQKGGGGQQFCYISLRLFRRGKRVFHKTIA